MLGGTQMLIIYFLFPKLGYHLDIDFIDFAGGCLSCLLIAGGGNLINDIYDAVPDAINKPGKNLIGQTISRKKAKKYYLFLNILSLGLIIAVLVKLNVLEKIWVYLSCILLLFIYSKKIKGILLISNLLVSFLILISVWVLPLTFVQLDELIEQKLVIGFLFSFSLIAFLLNLAREINKDIEDIKGDYAKKLKTIPIVLGRKTSRQIIYFILFISIISILFYYYYWFERNWISLIYFSIFLFAPLFWISMEYQKQKINYKSISIVLKITMLFGVLSILLL